MLRRIFGLLVLALAFLPSVRAWEDKGHTIINQLAAEAMPADTPEFFKKAATVGLPYLGPEPDRWKNFRRGAANSLYAVNYPDHFMDMEFVEGMELPESRYAYLTALATKGVKAKYGIEPESVGFLPYRITELTQTLQSQWRDWLAAPTETERQKAEKAQIEQAIIYTAGTLGHYVADGSNPHHTTAHYNGWDVKVAPNPKGYNTEKGIHRYFERDFVEAFVSVGDVRSLMSPVKPVGPVFADSLAYLRETNKQVVPLYELDKQNAFRAEGEVNAEGKRFVCQRLAAGASKLRDIWTMAMKGVPASDARN